MKKVRRIDKNQTEIVKIFRKMGVIVYITSSLGHGFPDLIILLHNRIWLIEIKNGKLAPSAQKLTPPEKIFFDIWRGHVIIIDSVEKAINFVNTH